ncbi:unnamed protein product [Rotaria sp. Silwood1]|nr:unnamed protein product [Rotaria sp. Silwood1]
MSLFKAREWWSCQVGSGEQFDYGCLKVGSFTEDLTKFRAISLRRSLLLEAIRSESDWKSSVASKGFIFQN